ncbi:unnamed protein product [Rangifer tarandus platyrhynchus]|uniref:Basic proline-rich protein-like n=2 Tax=Rangifer tarandus platyrhynchus TaxID=3082113 RepID=A0ABN8Y193_RANTA|nr:unnamed protein product [Rangifer tarandus platyrhynchus]CAI9692823.1 unnamed protein product [Rangifer tarandus platyrhynchus]
MPTPAGRPRGGTGARTSLWVPPRPAAAPRVPGGAEIALSCAPVPETPHRFLGTAPGRNCPQSAARRPQGQETPAAQSPRCQGPRFEIPRLTSGSRDARSGTAMLDLAELSVPESHAARGSPRIRSPAPLALRPGPRALAADAAPEPPSASPPLRARLPRPAAAVPGWTPRVRAGPRYPSPPDPAPAAQPTRLRAPRPAPPGSPRAQPPSMAPGLPGA